MDLPTDTNTPTATPTNTLGPTLVTPTSALNAAPPLNFFTSSIRTLTWNPVTGAQGYVLQISLTKDFTNSTETIALPAESLSYTTYFLSNDTYYWRVAVLGSTRWSNVETFTISALPTPTAVF